MSKLLVGFIVIILLSEFWLLKIYYNNKNNYDEAKEKISNNQLVIEKNLKFQFNQINNVGNYLIGDSLTIDSLKSKLTKKITLMIYINDNTCSLCIDNTIVDILSVFNKRTENVILLTSISDAIDLEAIKSKTKNRFPIINNKIKLDSVKLISPCFLVVNDKLQVINSFNYIQELPNHNIAFIKASKKLLFTN